MATLFRFLSGNTSDFAIEIEFQEDDGPNDDLRSTWGALRIWSSGINLCAHLEDGLEVDAVHWYLLPFLEWSVRNWDSIFHEERLPVRADDTAGAAAALSRTPFPPPVIENDPRACAQWESAWQSWWSRHALQSCREGGIFPDLAFRRWRDRFEVSWTDEPVAGQPDHFRFHAQRGSTFHDVGTIAGVWFELLTRTSAYLMKERPRSIRIRRLDSGIRGLDSLDRNEDRLHFMLGIADRRDRGWWTQTKAILEARPSEIVDAAIGIPEARSSLVIEGHCHAALMFGSVDPRLNNADRRALMECLIESFDPKGDGPNLKKLVRPSLPSRMAGRPWLDGYELARAVIEKLKVEYADGFVDIENIYRKLGIVIRDFTLADSGIRGVSVAGPSHHPTAWINRGDPRSLREPSRRFTLAHELCHILHDRISGSKLAIASGPWAPDSIEKRANAFAAMMLMPEDLVRSAFKAPRRKNGHSPFDTSERIRTFAAMARVSPAAAGWHLHNLGYVPSIDELEF